MLTYIYKFFGQIYIGVSVCKFFFSKKLFSGTRIITYLVLLQLIIVPHAHALSIRDIMDNVGRTLLATVLSSDGSMQVWVEGSLVRVGQTDAPGTTSEAHVYAARGETESFQVIVRARTGNLTNATIAHTNLVGPNNAVIPRENIRAYRQYYVTVSPSSPNWGGTNRPLGAGVYPDALIPAIDPITGKEPNNASLRGFPFDVSVGNNQPIWFDVTIPENQAPGVYRGSITVTSSQGNVTIPVTVTVWNFTLPKTPHLESSFLVWSGERTEHVAEELLRHRLWPLSAPVSRQSSWINTYGLGATGLPFWSGADQGNCTMSPAPTVSSIISARDKQDARLKLYAYTADEISSCPSLYGRIREWGRNLHLAGVDQLITMPPVTELFDDGSGTGRSAVDIWVILPMQQNARQQVITQAITKGDRVWSYNTLVQDSYSPKWQIDFRPADFRIQGGFLNQNFGLTGLLYWKVNDWRDDRWQNVNNIGIYSSANFPGEGMLVYPGDKVGLQGVAPSMRLKWLRDSVDDYDYIELLKKQGHGDWALAQVRTIASSWTNWSRDPQAIETVRLALGSKLNELGGGFVKQQTPPPPLDQPVESLPSQPESPVQDQEPLPQEPVNQSPDETTSLVSHDTQTLSIRNIQAIHLKPTSVHIAWNVSVPATGQVEYGTTRSYGLKSTHEPSLLTYHEQVLTGLEPGKRYYYQIVSQDAKGNVIRSTRNTFQTPSLSLPKSTLSNVHTKYLGPTSVHIAWNVSVPATGQVEYGTTRSYGLKSTHEPSLLTYHEQVLTGLEPGKRYYYRVVSYDQYGRYVFSSTYSFRTPSR